MDKLKGVVIADQVEVRLSFSGQIAQVFKRPGEKVVKGEALIQLDTKPLQTELDKELADYEKTRAQFELFGREHTGNDDNTKFLKIISQAELNASVKAVELAKMRLDQARLLSPVNGIVIDDGGSRVGIFASPASNAFTILDLDSIRIRVELKEAKFENADARFKAREIIWDGKKRFIDLDIEDKSGFRVGEEVEIEIVD